MLVLFFVFMVLGMPIAYCMGLAAILTVLVDGQLPVLLLAQQFYDSLDNFSLLAVPLFILAGELMSVGGVIPGVLAGLSMMILTWFLAPRAGAGPSPRASGAEALSATGRALPALIMPAIIIGGIR